MLLSAHSGQKVPKVTGLCKVIPYRHVVHPGKFKRAGVRQCIVLMDFHQVFAEHDFSLIVLP